MEYTFWMVSAFDKHCVLKWKEHMERNKGIPEDIKVFINATHYLKDHPGASKQMGENCRRVVNEVFN